MNHNARKILVVLVGNQGANCALHPLIHTLLKFALALDVGMSQDGCIGKRKAPRHSVARIEGPVKSPLTTTENHCGQPEEAYGDLRLKSPSFTLRRIENVTQICQYEKPPFLP